MVRPIVVRAVEDGTWCGGGRRWGLPGAIGDHTCGCKEYTKQGIDEIALIENIQREDLNPLEEAMPIIL